MSVVLIIVIGFMAGIFSGLFGIGGGIVMVPALILLAHFPLVKATGTSLAAILLPVGIFGVLAYYRARLIDVRASVLIATGLVISVVIGAWLAHSLPADIMRKLYALFCLYVSWTFIQPLDLVKKYFGGRKGTKERNGEMGENLTGTPTQGQTQEKKQAEIEDMGQGQAQTYAQTQAYTQSQSQSHSQAQTEPCPQLADGASTSTHTSSPNPRPHFLALVGVGLVAGIMSGMFGIGGGNIIVPFLILFLHYPPKRAIATSLGALLAPVGLPGVVYYYKAGTLDIKIAALLALGLLLGTVFGARINIKTSSRMVKLLYGLFLIFVAARFLFF
ncbi:MAG: sulfite exporter TauE/SafE family protein [Candidatus Aminicenantes bacterium]|nr:sulfite exporter TauE/SafE family protein [Candidatus Aminicenantes bacterium]